MLAIAGQTGGPNWLNFLEETFFFLIRNFEFLLVFLKFHGQNWALRLVNNIILFRKRH